MNKDWMFHRVVCEKDERHFLKQDLRKGLSEHLKKIGYSEA